MWFAFPEGTNRINVQLQEFVPEAKDKEGREYFRAPDHFAGLILDLPGFRAATPPEGAPPDLPPSSPVHEAAVTQLGGQVDALKLENEGLRAANAELKVMNNDLRIKLHEAEATLKNFDADGGAKAPVTAATSVKK